MRKQYNDVHLHKDKGTYKFTFCCIRFPQQSLLCVTYCILFPCNVMYIFNISLFYFYKFKSCAIYDPDKKNTKSNTVIISTCLH